MKHLTPFTPLSLRDPFHCVTPFTAIEKTAKQVQEEIKNVQDDKPDPIGLRVTLEALKIWNNPEAGKKYASAGGRNTCNQFVDDVLVNAGLHPPRRFGIRGVGPKGAGEWHQPVMYVAKDMEEGGTGALTPVYQNRPGKDPIIRDGPQMGGVISYPDHVALHAGNMLTIGTTQTPTIGAEPNPVSIIHAKQSEPFLIFNVSSPNR